MNDDRVETPKQLAEKVGISVHHIKSLIRSGDLEHLLICGRTFIPSGAWARYVEANTKGGKQCRDGTKEQAQYLEKRRAFYVTWSANGRAIGARRARRQRRGSGVLRDWLVKRGEQKAVGPRDPSQVLVSEVLNDYMKEAKPSAAGSCRICCAAAGGLLRREHRRAGHQGDLQALC